MDGFTGNDKSMLSLKEVLEKYNIIIKLIPAHSSDQVQPLDLYGFNVQKLLTQKYKYNHHYSYQTNQILGILEGLRAIQTPLAITTAWHMAGIYRARYTKQASTNEIFFQDHIVDINRNDTIRNLHPKRMDGSQNRLKKYEVLEPDDEYPDRKELKFATPTDLVKPPVTDEEALLLRKKYSIRRYEQKITKTKNLLITDYGIKLTNQSSKAKRTPSSKQKPKNHRVAVLRIPPDT